MRNKKGKGPWLRRPDSLHAKMSNLKRSAGVKFTMDTLPGIETVLSNFNQIVIRQVTINKYLFCFYLPVEQISGKTSDKAIQ